MADIGHRHLSGFGAWLIWVFVHLMYLVGFENKLTVLFQWAWMFFTNRRGTRLITGERFRLADAELTPPPS